MKTIFLIILPVFLFLTACSDRDKIDSLKETIHTDRDKITSLNSKLNNLNKQIYQKTLEKNNAEETVKTEISHIEIGLKVLQGSYALAETYKAKLKVNLFSLITKYPIISGCVIQDGVWGGIKDFLTGNSEEEQIKGALVAISCLFVPKDDKYDDVESQIKEIDTKTKINDFAIDKIAEQINETSNNLDQKTNNASQQIIDIQNECDNYIVNYKKQKNSLSEEISSTQSDINSLIEDLNCEKDIICRIKRIF